MSDQMIHYRSLQLSSTNWFYITIVYGMNHEQQRQRLWTDLQNISQSMNETWCILGDFNAVLHQEDRYGGNPVTDHDI